ncbi:hypothetical protein LLEC1_02319 [Akanthomyces lecanii]|uniref:Uncharacterized protein n=1 Tax=Cordyceps confragosa TaxID=2714763 RepID=A0A179I5V1_CORDF|nr:hypothetical protein LLEC1_02319 [Akanthomyces lecanii]
MGRSLLDRIQAKLEFFRLEQHYTRRRHRRSTFVSNATPSATGSSTDSNLNRTDALHGEHVGASKSNLGRDMPSSPLMDMDDEPVGPMPPRKRLNRFRSMPSFTGSTTSQNSGSERRRSTVQWLDKKW